MIGVRLIMVMVLLLVLSVSVKAVFFGAVDIVSNKPALRSNSQTVSSAGFIVLIVTIIKFIFINFIIINFINIKLDRCVI